MVMCGGVWCGVVVICAVIVLELWERYGYRLHTSNSLTRMSNFFSLADQLVIVLIASS